ncbi:MAG TPA: hypothetical protein VLL52_22520 [Anaerolineae bacterium]|nr:hypothetical protein [Anaerolineae bacterium]
MTISAIMTDVTSVVGGIIPLADVAIYAAFGFVVTAGVLLVRRTSKALR